MFGLSNVTGGGVNLMSTLSPIVKVSNGTGGETACPASKVTVVAGVPSASVGCASPYQHQM